MSPHPHPRPHPRPHPLPNPLPHPISSRTHRCSSRTCFDISLPSDGVDRDTGGESGHKLKIICLACETFLAYVQIHLRSPDPPHLTVPDILEPQENFIQTETLHGSVALFI